MDRVGQLSSYECVKILCDEVSLYEIFNASWCHSNRANSKFTRVLFNKKYLFLYIFDYLQSYNIICFHFYVINILISILSRSKFASTNRTSDNLRLMFLNVFLCFRVAVVRLVPFIQIWV